MKSDIRSGNTATNENNRVSGVDNGVELYISENEVIINPMIRVSIKFIGINVIYNRQLVRNLGLFNIRIWGSGRMYQDKKDLPLS